MATALNQLQVWEITISDIENTHPGNATIGTAHGVPAGLATALNTLLKGQITSAQPMIPEEQIEPVRYNPITVHSVEGWDDPDWTFTSRAWSPDLLELHQRRFTSVWRAARNVATAGVGDVVPNRVGGAGIISSYIADADTCQITGVANVPLAAVDSSRSSSQNTTTITIAPIRYKIYGRPVNGQPSVILERDLETNKFILHGVDLLKGLSEYLA